MNLRRSELAIATGASVAAVALVYAMMLSERTALDHALQLAAPAAVLPGASVPLRAYVMRGVTAEDVPELVAAHVEVTITRGDRALASAELDASPATLTAEGALIAPDEEGIYLLAATARGDDGATLATVERELSVDSQAPPAAELGRLAAPLSQFALGPLVIEPSEVPPPAFAVRVSSGICVPDRRCMLLVELGSSALELRVEPSAAVVAAGSIEREGTLLSVPVRVTGSEGELTLAVLREGRVIARRSVRLPVALATPLLEVRDPIVREGRLPITAAPPPGRSTLLLDVARDGHFVRTLTVVLDDVDETGRGALDVDLSGLPEGIYRLQLRADPFPTERSASRLVRIGGPAEAPFDVEGPMAFAFAAAEAEASELELPRLVSGLAGDRARVEATQSVVRVVAIAGMLIAGVLLVMAILRRGIAAEADAEEVLRAAGATADRGALRQQRRTLVLAVLALALALLTGIALVAARGILGG